MKKRMFFVLVLAFIASVPVVWAQEAKKPKVEVVFVLDTTGSMGNLIDAAKQKIWAVVGTLTAARPAPRISLGLVGYRDRGDEYVTRLTPLTDDIDKVYGDLMSFVAYNGGDDHESVNQALAEAVRDIRWDKAADTYRVIFLVGDWGPHMDYPDDVKYSVSCAEAKKKGIIVNTIQMGEVPETVPVWQEIARATGGGYFTIGMTDIHTDYQTPFDKDIAELSAKFDGTKVFYGDAAAQAANDRKLRTEADFYAAAPESVVAQRSIVNLSEAGKLNFTGQNELVDQVASGALKLKDVKRENLPAEMQKMNDAEKEKYIAAKSQEREKIAKELSALNGKRQTYIQDLARKNAAREEKSFENQVFKSLKKQGAAKNLTLDNEKLY